MEQVKILRQIQADSIVFFMKVHNFHWNVKGKDFPQVHAATQKIYEEFADIFDDVAERIIQLGEVPYVTLEAALKAAKVKEESKSDFKSKDVLESILKDYEYFLGKFQKLSKVSSDSEDPATQGIADSQIAYLQKAIWMLKAQLA